MHRWLLPRMDTLRATMHDDDIYLIRRFRKLHVAGIALNITQLVVVGWALTQVQL